MADSVLSRDWSSRWRPVRNVLALAVVVLAVVAVPLWLLLDVLSGTPIGNWPTALSRNAGLVLVTGIWSLLVLTLYGGHLRAAVRDYRRHF
ncbi:MAG: hypothetical protein ABEJ42_09210 [Halobacteriaceae archaeon]